MYCIVLRTPYTPNSGGQIVLRSLRGVSFGDPHLSVSKTTRRILGLVAIHPPTIPMHIACMYHLSNLHSKLFILAHEMVDKEPENAVSWYAVGVWYLTAKKWQDARTYFRYIRARWKKQRLTIMKASLRSWTLALLPHGWPSLIHSHWKESTTTQSQHTRRVRVSFQGWSQQTL
jgi:hypothetical protein